MPATTVAKSLEVLVGAACGEGGSKSKERRRRARLQLRWPVCFSGEDGRELTHATTLNLSSDGFYCLSQVAFVAGQELDCLLLFPSHHPEGRDRKAGLDCHVRVLRVTHLEVERMFGIACKIEDYRFVQL